MSFPIYAVLCTGSTTLFGLMKNLANCKLCTQNVVQIMYDDDCLSIYML